MTGWTDAQQSHIHQKVLLCMPVVKTNFDMMQLCGHLLGMALLYVMFSCVIVTFPYGVLGQVLYLIVFIPDLCLLSYFYLMHTCAKFYQNILCSSRYEHFN